MSAVSARGDMRFEVIQGKMNSDLFIKFLYKLCDDTTKPIIAIVDNASYLNSNATKRFCKENNISLESLPAYSPELNPDEQVWNHLKSRLAKYCLMTKQEMKKRILSLMFSIQKSKSLIRSFFKLKDTSYAAL